MPAGTDKYANMISLTCTPSAANTLTFGDIDLGLSLFQKVGIIVHRIHVEWSNDLLSDLTDDEDYMQIGISQSNQIASLSLVERAMIWKAKVYVRVFGAATTVVQMQTETIADLSGLPGGGELMAPRPLYWGITSGGLAGAWPQIMRVWFTIIELKAEEYFELLEARRFFG